MDSLPQPNGPFVWLQVAGGPALVCQPLENIAPHVFTTRSWQLGTPDRGEELAKWQEVAVAIQCRPEHLVRVAQVHGRAVFVAHRADSAAALGPSAFRAEADIIVSSDPDLGLAVRSADCVPLLVADSAKGAAAAAHSGWRGIAARVAETTVHALVREYGCLPRDLVAAAGPSIGPCCYEVGVDVRESFAAEFGAGEVLRWFLPGRRPDHWFFDQWGATRDQLVAAGLSPSKIFIAELCTAHNSDVFCSYRRDGPPAGRLAAAIRPGKPRPWRY